MNTKNAILAFLGQILVLISFYSVAKASTPVSGTVKTQNNVIWYNQPAKDWMTEALPIGNGRIGGMIFGGVEQEHIQFNENSLWTGDEKNTGEYQNFGDLFITFSDNSLNQSSPSDYRRLLDISKSIHQINYTSRGIVYHREYFCSYPDQVMVMKYSSGKPAAYSAIIELKDAHSSKTSADKTSLTFGGTLNNGLRYEARVTIKLKGGKISVIPVGYNGGYQLKIDKADEMIIYLAAATNYLPQRDKEWRGEDPHDKVVRQINAASKKTYEALRKAHIRDYVALFGRVAIDLGKTDSKVVALPMNTRLSTCRTRHDPQLEALLFQWGRYLLISSSRPGGLPANLQGLWNNSNTPPWRCDYHSNINIQMNYWLAEPTNLSECHLPFFDYVINSREARREQTREHYTGVRGWTYQTENNIFGGASWIWNPPASAWYAQHFWEHYAFTQDQAFLKNVAYPVMKEICEFWEDHLKKRADGTLVTPDGWSPEHGPEGEGVTYDQEIVYDLFTNYIEAADILGIDKDYRNKVSNMREKLLKPKIGKWGQLQEWEEDIDDPKDNHRHASHLFALHPGREISPIVTPALANAAKVSLTARGDGATGWSMAWKMNFWARLFEGDHAYTILSNFMTLVGDKGTNYNNGGGVYTNLFCAHPPFQIDGNFGYTAGVSEMLLQSQSGLIHLLPALPQAWSTGSVKGLRARGGFEIDIYWQGGALQKTKIKSLSGNPLKILYKGKSLEYNLKAGEEVTLNGKLEKK